MKRALLLLPFLLIAGCTVNRKDWLQTSLPNLVTNEYKRTANASNTNGSAVCDRVVLVEESKGHYTGTAYFKDGRQTSIKVTDDGQNTQFETAPF